MTPNCQIRFFQPDGTVVVEQFYDPYIVKDQYDRLWCWSSKWHQNQTTYGGSPIISAVRQINLPLPKNGI